MFYSLKFYLVDCLCFLSLHRKCRRGQHPFKFPGESLKQWLLEQDKHIYTAYIYIILYYIYIEYCQVKAFDNKQQFRQSVQWFVLYPVDR